MYLILFRSVPDCVNTEPLWAKIRISDQSSGEEGEGVDDLDVKEACEDNKFW